MYLYKYKIHNYEIQQPQLLEVCRYDCINFRHSEIFYGIITTPIYSERLQVEISATFFIP